MATTAELFDQALALHQAGRLDEAEPIYCRLLPTDPRAHHMLGMVWYARGDYEHALKLVDRAIERGAAGAAVLSNRASVLTKLDRAEEALACCDEAIAADPSYANAFYNRGCILRDLDRLGEALASFERAIALDPYHAPAHYSRGLLLLLNGDLERGLAEYEWRPSNNTPTMLR